MTGGPVVLCCGEAVADLVPATLADGSSGLRAVPGGAAVNTSVALARLGVPAGFVGALSRDTLGQQIAAHLEGAGVALDLAEFSDRPGTLALAHPVGTGTRFELYDAGSAGRHFGGVPALPDTARLLLFGGISLINPPAADRFEALATASDLRVWLDLNIRPALVEDPAPYRARLARMMARADVVKVSDEDLDWLGMGPGALPVKPGTLVLHTRGAGGADARWPGGHVSRQAPNAQVRDTVGAGDVFNAGVIASLWRAGALDNPGAVGEALLRQALETGVRAASISVTRPGADGPTWEEMTCAP